MVGGRGSSPFDHQHPARNSGSLEVDSSPAVKASDDAALPDNLTREREPQMLR